MAAESKSEEKCPFIVAIGDKVTLTDNKRGEIAFIGAISGKIGIQFGIILDNEFIGNTNGTFNKISYFETKSNGGLFVTKDEILSSKRESVVYAFYHFHNLFFVCFFLMFFVFILALCFAGKSFF